MPRPSITMVFHRTSRSSRSAASQDSEGSHAEASHPDTSGHPPHSPPSGDSSLEKRIRKPSQRMIEALQDDSDGNSEKQAASSAIAKGKRKGSPVSQHPLVFRSKRVRATAKSDPHVTDDATPEAIVDDFGFTTPDRAPRKKSKYRESEPPVTDESGPVPISIVKKTEKHSVTRNGRTRSQMVDELYVPEESIPSSSATEEETTEATETSADEGSLSPKKIKKLRCKIGKAPPKNDSVAGSLTKSAESVLVTAAEKSGLDKSAKTKKKSLPVEPAVKDQTHLPVSVALADNSAGLAGDAGASSNDAFLTNERRLTARQRAKLYGAEEHLIKLEDPRAKTPPPDYLEKKEERNKKRRAQAAERREELKTEIVQGLLHKAPSAKRAAKSDDSSAKRLVKYVINKFGTSIFYPEDACAIQPMLPISPPAVVKCGVSGCKQPKKYNCSKTGLPLCSLECYKKNQNRRVSVRSK